MHTLSTRTLSALAFDPRTPGRDARGGSGDVALDHNDERITMPATMTATSTAVQNIHFGLRNRSPRSDTP